MENDVDLLNYIYKNAEMGIIGIDDVIFKAKDPKLIKLLKRQRTDYEKACKMCKVVVKSKDCEIKKNNMMAKISSDLMSEMKLNKGANDKTIIKMMIEGSYKGLEVLSARLVGFTAEDKNVQDMAGKYLVLINKNIDELKKIKVS